MRHELNFLYYRYMVFDYFTPERIYLLCALFLAFQFASAHLIVPREWIITFHYERLSEFIKKVLLSFRNFHLRFAEKCISAGGSLSAITREIPSISAMGHEDWNLVTRESRQLLASGVGSRERKRHGTVEFVDWNSSDVKF